jgi:hypothetical protein
MVSGVKERGERMRADLSTTTRQGYVPSSSVFLAGTDEWRSDAAEFRVAGIGCESPIVKDQEEQRLAGCLLDEKFLEGCFDPGSHITFTLPCNMSLSTLDGARSSTGAAWEHARLC